jgi:hypothetical protein
MHEQHILGWRFSETHAKKAEKEERSKQVLPTASATREQQWRRQRNRGSNDDGQGRDSGKGMGKGKAPEGTRQHLVEVQIPNFAGLPVAE